MNHSSLNNLSYKMEHQFSLEHEKVNQIVKQQRSIFYPVQNNELNSYFLFTSFGLKLDCLFFTSETFSLSGSLFAMSPIQVSFFKTFVICFDFFCYWSCTEIFFLPACRVQRVALHFCPLIPHRAPTTERKTQASTPLKRDERIVCAKEGRFCNHKIFYLFYRCK